MHVHLLAVAVSNANFELMKYAAILLFSIFVLIFSSCDRAEEPFEYPADPIDTTKVLIPIAQRTITSQEVWIGTNSESECSGSNPTESYARFEVDLAAGNNVLRLIPDSATCILDASLATNFIGDELSDLPLEELTFEFTFSNTILSNQTELWLSWYYHELEFDLNIAPYLFSDQQPDLPLSGLVSLKIVGGSPVVNILGTEVDPVFNSSISDNHFAINASNQQNYFQTAMHSENTKEQSLLLYRFLRISTMGIPE